MGTKEPMYHIRGPQVEGKATWVRLFEGHVTWPTQRSVATRVSAGLAEILVAGLMAGAAEGQVFERMDIEAEDDLIAQFHARGGQVKSVAKGATNGMKGADWSRAQRGLTVISDEQLADRKQELMIAAVKASDVNELQAILLGRRDKKIKADLEEAADARK